jgi:lipopolysaccharide transport system ATP-binding protein
LESASEPGAENRQGSGRKDSPTSPVDYEAKYLVQDNLAGSDGWKSAAAELISADFLHRNNSGEKIFEGGEPVRLTIRARAHQKLEQPILGFIVKDRLGQDLFGENTLPFSASRMITVQPGEEFQAEFDFVLPMLPNGEYVAMVSVADGTLHDHVQHHYLHEALVITVHSSMVRWGLTGLMFDRVSMDICSD